ncbi:MAG: hypothetical protein ACRDFS_09250, partial [Chloroflexota bacterium]
MRARTRQRGFIDLRGITLGDWIVLIASAVTVISLFMTWFSASTPKPHGEWAFTYSEVASVVVIVLFLFTLFLVVYPALASETNIPAFPFASPVLFFIIGSLVLLVLTYE